MSLPPAVGDYPLKSLFVVLTVDCLGGHSDEAGTAGVGRVCLENEKHQRDH